MFVLAQGGTFKAPVKFSMAGDSERQPVEFTATFKRLDRAALDGIGKNADGSDRSDLEVCREVLAGWSGVTDEAGAAVTFNPANLEALLSIPGMDRVIALAFFSEVQALPRKN